MCPLCTHVTPILYCVGPCSLFGSIWSMFTIHSCCRKHDSDMTETAYKGYMQFGIKKKKQQ